jgi:predicted Ser/Thr protein kinase
MKSKKIRTSLIIKNISKLTCLKAYNKKIKFLAAGTVGSVFLSCKSAGKICHAVKIQLITNQVEKKMFREEVRNQKAFYPYAPKVYSSRIQKIGEHEFATIVMDRVGPELDKYLMTTRTSFELDQLIYNLSRGLLFLKEKQITHGDLALFNIALTYDEKDIVFIDFDRASKSVYRPDVDILRLVVEWYIPHQSKGTKIMRTSNIEYLIEQGIPVWKKLYPPLHKDRASISELDERWVDAYEAYCLDAGVRCLDD